MELNEIHTEHEHATTSLKVVLLVFAIVLVGALAYLVWAQNTAPDTTDNATVVTKKNTADETADWSTWTRSDQMPNTKFTVKLPTGWKAYGSDSGGRSVLTAVDSKYTDDMYRSGGSMDPYAHVYFDFVYNQTNIDSWVSSFGDGSNIKVVTISDEYATYREEKDGVVAYYFDLSKTYGTSTYLTSVYLRAYYKSADSDAKNAEFVVKTLDFTPTESVIKAAKQIP